MPQKPEEDADYWMEEASTLQLQKKGLGFFNCLISALAQKFLTELTD
jgi:hypothetical protein